jgi:hypothetical protein
MKCSACDGCGRNPVDDFYGRVSAGFLLFMLIFPCLFFSCTTAGTNLSTHIKPLLDKPYQETKEDGK